MAVAIELGPRAQLVERWLRDRGVESKYEEAFPLADINMEKSLKNQARLERPIDETAVQQYAADMQNGDEFPPLVVWKDGRSFVLVSGVHRTLAALAAGLETFPTFVVTNDNRMAIAVLTYEANTEHGMPTSMDERVVQAMYLVDNGLTHADAAKLLHVPAAAVSRAAQTRRTRDRLSVLGFKGAKAFADTKVQRLAALRADEVLVAGAELVRDAGMSFEDTNDFVVRVNKLRSDAEQLEFIQMERDRLKTTISARVGGVVKLPRSVSRLAMVCGSAVKLDMPNKKEIDTIPTAYLATLKGRVVAARDRLDQALEKLGGSE